MRPAEVLKQMKEMREQWRKQSFSFTREQEVEYEKLRQLRYKRVKEMYDRGQVSKGGLKKKETEQTAPET